MFLTPWGDAWASVLDPFFQNYTALLAFLPHTRRPSRQLMYNGVLAEHGCVAEGVTDAYKGFAGQDGT